MYVIMCSIFILFLLSPSGFIRPRCNAPERYFEQRTKYRSEVFSSTPQDHNSSLNSAQFTEFPRSKCIVPSRHMRGVLNVGVWGLHTLWHSALRTAFFCLASYCRLAVFTSRLLSRCTLTPQCPAIRVLWTTAIPQPHSGRSMRHLVDILLILSWYLSLHLNLHTRLSRVRVKLSSLTSIEIWHFSLGAYLKLSWYWLPHVDSKFTISYKISLFSPNFGSDVGGVRRDSLQSKVLFKNQPLILYGWYAGCPSRVSLIPPPWAGSVIVCTSLGIFQCTHRFLRIIC